MFAFYGLKTDGTSALLKRATRETVSKKKEFGEISLRMIIHALNYSALDHDASGSLCREKMIRALAKCDVPFLKAVASTCAGARIRQQRAQPRLFADDVSGSRCEQSPIW